MNQLHSNAIVLVDFALVVDYESENSNDIEVIDLTDLSNPKLLTKIHCDDSERGIGKFVLSRNNNKLFVSVGRNIKIFSIDDFSDIKLLKTAKIHSGSFAITDDDKYLYAFGNDESDYCESKNCSGFILYEIKDTLVFLKSFYVATSQFSPLQYYSWPFSQVTISPDGNKLAFSFPMAGALILADISHPSELNVLGFDSESFR